MPLPDRRPLFHLGSIPAPAALRRRPALDLRWRNLAGVLDRGRPLRATLLTGALLGVVWLEATTGMFQAFVFSSINSSLHYRVEPGPSNRIAFPSEGPFDAERGYRAVPAFADALLASRMAIHEQSRFSTGLLLLTWLKIPLAYPDKPVAGLVIRDARGDTLFDAAARRRWFRTHGEIPPLVARSLMYIENRDLAAEAIPTQNPAVDWGRFARATLLWSGRAIGLPLPVEGGSTLAVQLVKYRHSEDGRTDSALDKLRQIAAASLTAYRKGPDTREARRQFLLDYLNTIPLASAPGFGEVAGLNDGLTAWFGLEPAEVWRTLAEDTSAARRAAAYKPVLALLCAAQAPSRFLRRDPAALERRVDAYTRLFLRDGILDPGLARATLATRLEVRPGPRAQAMPAVVRAEHKPAYAVRRDLAARLEVRDFYTLDRLDLDVETTLDHGLQQRALALFRSLADSSFLRAHGLRGERLLRTGDPRQVQYSLMLYESHPHGDRVRVHVDNLDRPFDLNTGMKLELGSTAKLRTLVHYLQIVERLHAGYQGLDRDALRSRMRDAADPLSRDVAAILADDPGAPLAAVLAAALDRRYPAAPGERFFTGGGEHVFHNFDEEEDARTFTVREAFAHSNNLVFVRLMRDLVRWHEARLPYDAHAVLMGEDMAARREVLVRAADDEARQILARAWRRMRGAPPAAIERQMLGAWPGRRSLAALYYAWHRGGGERGLAEWIAARTPKPVPGAPAPSGAPPVPLAQLARVYGNPDFTLLDYAYVLRRHALELWCAGELAREPDLGFERLWARSGVARELCRRWLMDDGRFEAQNLRLRTRIERDAFERMTADWRALGFPFERLVPSLGTALGASGDRPAALSELMGILVADGVRRPAANVSRMVLAGGTPYHTAFESVPDAGRRVLSPAVARSVREALAGVVAHGTARRVQGAFDGPAGPLVVGGKTGSGDNGVQIRSGRQPTSRTATFAFYIGDRHYGVITASVLGRDAAHYEFTSSLPLAVLRLLAPAIEAHVGDVAPPRGTHARPPGPSVIAAAPSPARPF